MTRTAFDAVVIGAGPAGSTVAALLARSGWTVALVERQQFPRRKVCGECIAASNLPLLHELGLGDALRAAGPELRRVAILCESDSAVADLPAAPVPAYAWGRALGRESLDHLLLASARAAGAEVFQPWSARALSGGAGRWNCEMRTDGGRHKLRLRASLAIAAHGTGDPAALGEARQAPLHKARDLLAFKANFRDASLPEGLLPVLALDGGYGGMVIADGGLMTLACCIRRDRLEALRRAAPGERAGEVVERWLRSACRGVDLALRRAQRVGPWLASGPIAPGVHVRADDTLFRVGNAAGEAHPILGEGISMALQSAALLAGLALARDPGSASAQQALAREYARQWRARFGARLRIAALFAQLAMRPAGARLLLALARNAPGALALGARWGGKLHSAASVGARGENGSFGAS